MDNILAGISDVWPLLLLAFSYSLVLLLLASLVMTVWLQAKRIRQMSRHLRLLSDALSSQAKMLDRIQETMNRAEDAVPPAQSVLVEHRNDLRLRDLHALREDLQSLRLEISPPEDAPVDDAA